LTFLGFPLESWVAQLYVGLVNGCVFILLALGLSIIFGLMGIVNFAHGVFYMLGAYAAYSVIAATGSYWLALAAAPLIVGVLGLGVERGIIRRIYGVKNAAFAGVLVTYGLSILLPDFVRMLYGRPGKPVRIPPELTGDLLTIGGTKLGAYRLFILIVTAVVVPLLWLLLNKTNLGLVIRAGTSDSLMVQALGINVSRVWTITFGLGIALAAFAGVVTAPMLAVSPEMGGTILIQCFIVVVIGGMGSFAGPIVGGLIIGQVLSLTSMVYDVLADVIIYVAMAAVLLLRPRGLFGVEGVED